MTIQDAPTTAAGNLTATRAGIVALFLILTNGCTPQPPSAPQPPRADAQPESVPVKPQPEPAPLTTAATPALPTVKPAPDRQPSARPVQDVPKKQSKIAPPTPPAAPPANKSVPTDLTIEGYLNTGGIPWAANSVAVRILWLKSGKPEVKLGQETAWFKPEKDGMRYQLQLQAKPQFINWNNGVEGNIGRVVAYVDMDRDGRFHQQRDKLIAVSEELVRYRTGRYDANALNDSQQADLRKEGSGYLVIKWVQVDANNGGWDVADNGNPAQINLSADNTKLTSVYSAVMKGLPAE
ncbi:MAG: hypothetical protein OEZ39_15740 [Gammaproteobacteria bacterium]|nr:hypothetical protein [Gammaproteobacteria bacterium]MDH5653309.1 hypothetical protein [Gammaproteobacteria bacterium]